MSPKDLLLQAKLGGYTKSSDQLDPADLMKPSFWKALSFALGWEVPQRHHYHSKGGTQYRVTRRGTISFEVQPHNWSRVVRRKNMWRKKWRTFIDALADGKTYKEAIEEI